MKFHVLTLFPDMIRQGLLNSITGRAIKQNQISVDAVDIRDFATDKHRKVDDYTYGGGAGMLMQPQPVYDAWNSVCQKSGKSAIRTVYVTPQGLPFTQHMAQELAGEEELIFLCGHYEGIDERVLEEVVTDYVSIGDYVLTGGELPAMVMIDAISRLVPGVLNNEMSAETESFHAGLLEYPQYSRPKIWHGKEVPQVLLSGNGREIARWRMEQSVERTRLRRPDLYLEYQKLCGAKDRLMQQKLLHIDMIELINRGNARLVYQSTDGNEILLQDMCSKAYLHTNLSVSGEKEELEGKLPFLDEVDGAILAEIDCLVLHQRELMTAASERLLLEEVDVCYQAVCTRREKLPVSGLYRPDGRPMENGLSIRTLDDSYTKLLAENYPCIPMDEWIKKEDGTIEDEALQNEWNCYNRDKTNVSYISSRLSSGAICGAFLPTEDGEVLAGFAGTHTDGSIGFLTVFPEYRHRKIAMALETYVINGQLEQGFIPYGQVLVANESAQHLQTRLGLYLSKTPIVWMS